MTRQLFSVTRRGALALGLGAGAFAMAPGLARALHVPLCLLLPHACSLWRLRAKPFGQLPVKPFRSPPIPLDNCPSIFHGPSMTMGQRLFAVYMGAWWLTRAGTGSSAALRCKPPTL